MFKNYLKIAVRNLMKRKGYSLINILGLATGIAVCLLIILFIQSELGYDKHHKESDRIYRVVLERLYPERSTSYSFIPQSIGESIQKEYPEVIESTRLFNFGGNFNFFMRVGDKVFEEKKVLAADSNFFRVFTGDFVNGNPATALMQPNSAVLSESIAIQMYGSAQGAMGKQFQTDADENNTFMITAVCKDWPENSHFSFNILISATSFPFIRQPNYINFAAHTYLLLSPNASSKNLEAKLPVIVEKYVAGEIERNFGQSYKDFKAAGNGYNYYLQPLKKIHLISDLEGELSVNGSITSVYIFSVIAVFILFLACINFINLSTARSVERAKEVGIRKTFGSDKRSLIAQFLVESVLISITALFLAIGLIFIFLPLFNQLSGKSLTFTSFIQPARMLLLALFAIIVGIIAGLYPAFVLSSFRPILVLKGRFTSNRYGLLLRNGLVVFQFAISVILIISAIIVSQQMKYMLSGKLGFKKDQIIIVERADLLQQQTETFKTELMKIPGVEIVSGTTTMPGTENFFGVSFKKEASKESLTGRGIIVDENFAKTLDLKLIQGRFFSKTFGTDSLSLVLNEKAVSELGLTNPIGARLTSPDDIFNAPDSTPHVYTVAGVIKDFHFQSLHQKIAPLIFINSAKFNNAANIYAVRIKADNFKSAVSSIENKWKKFVQNKPFHYTFFDQAIAAQYLTEQRTQRIFTIFSSLAIFIASIGLLGLVAYTTNQRTREISIRKVLGASAGNIVNMLSKDFLKLVAIASVISFPVAWWAMSKWLQDFAYRIDMSWWIFLIAGGLALLIALVTISFQSVNAALTNPVKNLRTE
ncbi:MAG: ABC transporter permease [Chitinophagaceae bacterium]